MNVYYLLRRIWCCFRKLLELFFCCCCFIWWWSVFFSAVFFFVIVIVIVDVYFIYGYYNFWTFTLLLINTSCFICFFDIFFLTVTVSKKIFDLNAFFMFLNFDHTQLTCCWCCCYFVAIDDDDDDAAVIFVLYLFFSESRWNIICVI